MSASETRVEPARCPVRADYNPFSGDAMTAPLTTLTAAASETPIFYDPHSKWWLVAGYAEISRVLRDTETFSSAKAAGEKIIPDAARHLVPEYSITGYPGLTNSDPPIHKRVRKLANKAFTPAVIRSWAPVVEQRAAELIDGFVADGQCDFLEAFAVPLPISVISDILGIPREDGHRVMGWSAALLNVHMSVLSEDELVEAWGQINDWSGYLDEMITERRREGKNDLTTRLIEAKDGDAPTLNNHEIRCVVTQLMLAGNETTRHLIATLARRMAEDPGLARRLVDADEDLLYAVVEEELRVRGPVRGMFRVATKDVKLGDATIREGDKLQLCFAAANHDERMFEKPGEFELDRDNIKRHVAFGRGEHFCLGAPLARLEGLIALRHIVNRLPNLRLATDEPIRWAPNVIVTGMERLDLLWDTTE
jgi:cytochrome P450